MEFSFKYSINDDEYADYNVYTIWSSPNSRKNRIKFFVNTFIYIFAFSTVGIIISRNLIRGKEFSSLNDIRTWTIVFAITIIFTFLSFIYYPLRIKSNIKKFIGNEENKNILSERILVINDTGIQDTDKTSQSINTWDSIIRYVDNKDVFYLYTSNIQALIIPKRVFSSKNETDTFSKYLTEKIPLSASFRSIGI